MARYVFCYDITDDRRRRQAAGTLDAYGDRIQDSIFEVSANRKIFKKCLEQIKQCINPEEDRIAVYTLCAICNKNAIYLGASADMDRTGEDVVFIA